ncbi:MAG: GDP-mannose 4,6-dehydratase [Candidatus Omnitrophica bacterium]|nr:GDP-mannose 4,6-dehydratase [Candidatus Omnitrophota bacterium]
MAQIQEKITVVGSNSFSGASFVAYCLSLGMEVLGISRSPELADVFLPYKWENINKIGKFRFENLDLNHDTDKIIDCMQKFRSEYVVNFAAQAMVAQSWEHPEHWYQTNVIGNVKLHDKIRNFNFLKKYVHVSTPEVYGNCTGQVTESTPFNPSTPYAASKAACDLHLRTFFNHYKFPVVFTRAANVYGPGQQLYRIIPRTILYIKLGKKLQLHGGGNSVRSFIHIQDVSSATLRIAQNAPAGEAYHISTGVYISIRELVELICVKMKADFAKVVEIADERPGKDAAYLLNSDKLRKDLGWADRIKLDDGINETVDWVNDNFEELKRQPGEYIHKE